MHLGYENSRIPIDNRQLSPSRPTAVAPKRDALCFSPHNPPVAIEPVPKSGGTHPHESESSISSPALHTQQSHSGFSPFSLPRPTVRSIFFPSLLSSLHSSSFPSLTHPQTLSPFSSLLPSSASLFHTLFPHSSSPISAMTPLHTSGPPYPPGTTLPPKTFSTTSHPACRASRYPPHRRIFRTHKETKEACPVGQASTSIRNNYFLTRYSSSHFMLARRL